MKWIRYCLEAVGNATLLLVGSLHHLPSLPHQLPRLIDQCFQIGYATVPIVALLSFFIGAVLALQTGDGIRAYVGAKDLLGSIVGLSLCKELGPVMTAFLLTGRVGSAMTAELASMKVYQEVDALMTMNIPIERILVLPRLVAVLLMMPLLTTLAIVLGWLGGAVIASQTAFLDVASSIYWRSLREVITFDIVMDGLTKAEIFGLGVVLICCTTGLNTRGGPREIGISVTRAVVSAMVFILLSDYFITKILL